MRRSYQTEVIQGSFARYGYDMNKRRFRHPVTITARSHVLAMSTDAYGLAVTALNRHAHAAAPGPIDVLAFSGLERGQRG
jgi:hypothetical protein